MKKLLAILLAAMVGISLALCSCGESEETSSGAETAGGWTAPDSPVVTKEVRAALEKACEKLTGATYEPIAYLGSQVVAGTNYRILCKRTLSAMIAEPTYAIVTVYEDLEGNAEITETFDLVAAE